ncbi:MAG: AIR synthase family protein [Nitrososphaerota archaeon]
MSIELPKIGKVDKTLFDEIILPKLGRRDRRILLGPAHGVDAAAVEISRDLVMVAAEDPTFGMPVLMPYFGWAIVHICASDVAVLGIKPRYMLISLLLPPGTSHETLQSIWIQVHEECRKLGISIIGGHTGVYPGISYPLNGGCVVIGFGRKNELRPSSNARPGDALLITKGAAIEAAGILAHQAEEELRRALGSEVLENAKRLIFQMSVVEDALTAARYCHAMHDATEGGVLNAIYEMAEASGAGVRVYKEKIPIPDPAKRICEYFGIDPLISISEGTLLISAPKNNVGKIISALKHKGIPAAVIGEFTKSRDRIIIEGDGSEVDLKLVKVDPFWEAYFSTLRR